MTFGLISEGAAFPATNPQFGRTVLEMSKFGAYLSNVPNELIADSPAFTEVFLPTIIARGLAFYEDDLMIASGNGVDQPEALVNAPAAVTVNRATSDAVVLADLIAMIKALHPECLPTATWLVSKSAHDQILDLYTAGQGQVWNGSALVSADMPVAPPDWYVPAGSGSGPRILGMEACVNDHQNALGDVGDVMLCDLGLMLLADRGEMSVEIAQRAPGSPTGRATSGSGTAWMRVSGRRSPYTTKANQTVSRL